VVEIKECSGSNQGNRKMASAPDLSDVPADTLFKEVLRRLKCSVKPEKRIILVGEMYYQFFN
jgi:hypothetical protein